MKTITAKTPEQVREWITNNPHYRGGWLDKNKCSSRHPNDAAYFELANRGERLRIPLNINEHCYFTAGHDRDGFLFQWDFMEEKVKQYRGKTVRIKNGDATNIGILCDYQRSPFSTGWKSVVVLDDGESAVTVTIDDASIIEETITIEEIKNKIESLDFDGDDRDDATIEKWEALIDPVTNGEPIFDRP